MLTGIASIIGAGQNNELDGSESAIVAGNRNIIDGGNGIFIGAGNRNKISGSSAMDESSIVGGNGNLLSGSYSFIGGGQSNKLSGSYNAILGGRNNLNNSSTREDVFIIGSNLTASDSLTTYMNNTVLTGSLTVGQTSSISSTVGRIDATNDVVAFATSDQRLKENIIPISSALDKINKINGVEFDWKPLTEEEKITLHGNEGHDIGVIAQEIEEILPEVVTTRENGYKAVNYEKIIPLLIEAIKEQQIQINQLKTKS